MLLISHSCETPLTLMEAGFNGFLRDDYVKNTWFVGIFESLNKFRGESAVWTYLVRIAINLSLNELKSRKRRFLFFSSEEAGAKVATPENQIDLKEMLDYEFNQLEPDFKAVATLRLIEGYSTEETADLLEIPLGTVLSRLSRAQKKLRNGLQKHLNP